MPWPILASTWHERPTLADRADAPTRAGSLRGDLERAARFSCRIFEFAPGSTTAFEFRCRERDEIAKTIYFVEPSQREISAKSESIWMRAFVKAPAGACVSTSTDGVSDLSRHTAKILMSIAIFLAGLAIIGITMPSNIGDHNSGPGAVTCASVAAIWITPHNNPLTAVIPPSVRSATARRHYRRHDSSGGFLPSLSSRLA
jgi:hypothetical protein